MNASFITSAVIPSQYPVHSLPEIAFAGRSNVGKSSLINTLVERKGLAKVGQTPGKTRLINFFNVEDKLVFVDLPGYGYAAVSKNEKKKWGQMIETFFNTRRTLSACVLLVDIRRVPSEDDMAMLHWFNHFSVKTVIAVTKVDKVSGNELAKQTAVICKTLGVEKEDLVHFSSQTRKGRDQLWERINAASNLG